MIRVSTNSAKNRLFQLMQGGPIAGSRRLSSSDSQSSDAQATAPSSPQQAAKKDAPPAAADQRMGPAMTSQILGVSLLDMATPASCMAARALRQRQQRQAEALRPPSDKSSD